MKNPVTLLRHIALAEAVSFLVLLFIAMPLKYAWGMPLAVRIVGALHGGLFVAYCAALYRATDAAEWPLKRAAGLFIASLLPFVPFFVDRSLRAWAQQWENRRA